MPDVLFNAKGLVLDRVLAKFFKARRARGKVLAQKNSDIADVHVEGQVFDLLACLIR